MGFRVAGFPGHWVAGSQNVTQFISVAKVYLSEAQRQGLAISDLDYRPKDCKQFPPPVSDHQDSTVKKAARETADSAPGVASWKLYFKRPKSSPVCPLACNWYEHVY